MDCNNYKIDSEMLYIEFFLQDIDGDSVLWFVINFYKIK